MIYRRYTIDLIFRGGWMSKKWVVFSSIGAFIVITILAIVIIHVPEGNSKIGKIIELILQMSAVCATIAVSTWGLTIAHRQIKHWEIEQCNKLWEEYDTLANNRNELVAEWNAKTKEYDEEIDENLTMQIFNFWERIALLGKKSYLDTDILYDSFCNSLFDDLEGGIFDDYLEECYQKNKHLYYHTRTLYIKWSKRYKKDQENKDLEKSWEEMVGLKKEFKEKEIKQLEEQIEQLDKNKEKEIAQLDKEIEETN